MFSKRESAAGHDVGGLGPGGLRTSQSGRFDGAPRYRRQDAFRCQLHEKGGRRSQVYLKCEFIERAKPQAIRRKFACVYLLSRSGHKRENRRTEALPLRIDDTPPGINEIVCGNDRSIAPAGRV